MSKVKIKICDVKEPDVVTYRHFIALISICRDVDQINLEKLSTRMRESILKNHEITVPCSNKDEIPIDLIKYCHNEHLYIKLLLEKP